MTAWCWRRETAHDTMNRMPSTPLTAVEKAVRAMIAAVDFEVMTRRAVVRSHSCHRRRFPAASIEQAFSIRLLCASGSFAESIQLIKSLRSSGVRSLHCAFAIGLAARAV